VQIPNLPLSFLLFRIDLQEKQPITVSHPPPFSLNNARIQLESRCLIEDRQTAKTTEFVLGASCKTERVGVEQDIWTEPNADFCPVLSQEECLILKSWAKIGDGPFHYPASLGRQRERSVSLVADAFAGIQYTLRMNEAEPLQTAKEIVHATLTHELLAGRVEFVAQERYHVLIDFPIKTMNANERDIIYQTDTGPILFPDFSLPCERLIDSFWLAYVAFNNPHWAEFILQVPVSLADGIAANHYAKPVRLETQNTLFRMQPTWPQDQRTVQVGSVPTPAREQE
jgi:hypothetical protein